MTNCIPSTCGKTLAFGIFILARKNVYLILSLHRELYTMCHMKALKGKTKHGNVKPAFLSITFVSEKYGLSLES